MVGGRCNALQGPSTCCRCQRRQSGDGEDKKGLNSKIHLAVDAHGMPVRIIATAGTTADCSQALALIDGISAQYLLAGRGYDSNELINTAAASSRPNSSSTTEDNFAGDDEHTKAPGNGGLRKQVFRREIYFHKLAYLAAMPSVRSTSLSTRASISSLLTVPTSPASR